MKSLALISLLSAAAFATAPVAPVEKKLTVLFTGDTNGEVAPCG